MKHTKLNTDISSMKTGELTDWLTFVAVLSYNEYPWWSGSRISQVEQTRVLINLSSKFNLPSANFPLDHPPHYHQVEHMSEGSSNNFSVLICGSELVLNKN